MLYTFSTKNQKYIIDLIQVLIDLSFGPSGSLKHFNPIIFPFTFRRKLSVIRCDIELFFLLNYYGFIFKNFNFSFEFATGAKYI